MSGKSLPLIALICISLALWFSRDSESAPQDRTPMPQWEYFKTSDADIRAIGDLGAQGWELVAVEPSMPYHTYTGPSGSTNVERTTRVLYFKRSK